MLNYSRIRMTWLCLQTACQAKQGQLNLVRNPDLASAFPSERNLTCSFFGGQTGRSLWVGRLSWCRATWSRSVTSSLKAFKTVTSYFCVHLFEYLTKRCEFGPNKAVALFAKTIILFAEGQEFVGWTLILVPNHLVSQCHVLFKRFQKCHVLISCRKFLPNKIVTLKSGSNKTVKSIFGPNKAVTLFCGQRGKSLWAGR